MPSYKDLMKLIRAGLSPEEIMARLDVWPSQMRRMLTSQRLMEELALQERLAREIVRHQTASGVHTVAAKLREIAFGERTETARKACLTLLAEGLRGGDEAPAADHSADPMALLTPAGAVDEPDDERTDG